VRVCAVVGDERDLGASKYRHQEEGRVSEEGKGLANKSDKYRGILALVPTLIPPVCVCERERVCV